MVALKTLEEGSLKLMQQATGTIVVAQKGI